MTSYKTRRQDALAIARTAHEMAAAMDRLVELELFVAQVAKIRQAGPEETEAQLDWAQKRARALMLRRVAKKRIPVADPRQHVMPEELKKGA